MKLLEYELPPSGTVGVESNPKRTSRRKGRRTGAIEVDETLFRRIVRDIRQHLEPTPGLLGEILGGKVIRRTHFGFPMPKKYVLRKVVGEYQVPTIRHRGPKVPVKVVLWDPEVAPWGEIPHLAKDTRTVEATKSQVNRWRREASERLGVPVSDLKAVDSESTDYAGALGYEIVLPVPIEQPLDTEALLPSLKSTLRHELAHAMDESLRQRHQQEVREDNLQLYLMHVSAELGLEPDDYIEATHGVSEGAEDWAEQDWQRYYNLPHEVVARLTQAVNELSGFEPEVSLELMLRKKGPGADLLVEWALTHSRSIRSMWRRLDEDNRRRVMVAIYEIARPIIEKTQ